MKKKKTNGRTNEWMKEWMNKWKWQNNIQDAWLLKVKTFVISHVFDQPSCNLQHLYQALGQKDNISRCLDLAYLEEPLISK